MGGYERDPAPWSLDGIPADFNGPLLAPDLPRFEPIMAGAIRRVPAMAEARVSRVINGPRVTPDNEFILGESEVGGFFVAAGFCGPRHRRCRRDRSPDGRLDHRGRTRARPLEDGHPTLRGGLPRRGVHARAGHRELRDLLRHPLSNEERQAGPAAADVARLRALARLGAVFGEKSGWERPNCRANAVGFGRRDAPAARLGGEHWSPAIAAEALATRAAAALFDETSFASSRSTGPDADALEHVARNDLDRPSARSCTRSCSTGAAASGGPHRHPPRRQRFLLVTGTAYGNHDAAWLRNTSPMTAAWRSATSRPRASASACGGRAARDILAGLTRDDLSSHGLPVPHRAGDQHRRRAAAGAAGHLRGRARLGLYAPTEYGRPCGHALVGGREHGLVAAGYRAIEALRLEKGYRVWSNDITPDETRTRPGSGSPWPSTRGGFLGRDALVAAKAAGPTKRLRAWCSTTRVSVCLGTSRSGSTATSWAGSRRAGTDSPSSAPSRTPTSRRPPPSGPAARSRSSASGSASKSPASRSTTPRTGGSAHDRRRHVRAEWSASLRLGTDAELRRWLDVAQAACDEADTIARAHFRRDLHIEAEPIARS